jgi:phage terminase small subunit
MAKSKRANPSKVLREKLIKFADLYRGSPDPKVRGNKTACYKAVNPRCTKDSSAAPKGCEYYDHAIVQERIRQSIDELGRRSDITQERVLREVARLTFYDVRKLADENDQPIPLSKLDDDIAAAIVGVKVTTVLGTDDAPSVTRYEYKLADKNSAAEKLMKYLGLYEKDNSQRSKSLTELLQEVRNNE